MLTALRASKLWGFVSTLETGNPWPHVKDKGVTGHYTQKSKHFPDFLLPPGGLCGPSCCDLGPCDRTFPICRAWKAW